QQGPSCRWARDVALALTGSYSDSCAALARLSQTVLVGAVVHNGLIIQLDTRVVGHVDPDVHVGRAAKVPRDGRAFEAPIVPHAVLPDVLILVEREAARVE